MNENKKLLAVLGVVVIVILAIVVSSVMGTQAQEKTIDEIDKLMDTKEGELIYLGRPTCSYCQQFTPILEDASDKYEFGYYYLNTDELDDEGQADFIESNDYFDEEGGYGTPMLIVVKDDEFVDVLEGLTDKDTAVNFFKDNGLIEE